MLLLERASDSYFRYRDSQTKPALTEQFLYVVWYVIKELFNKLNTLMPGHLYAHKN